MDEKRSLQRFDLELPVRIARPANGKEKAILNTNNICSQGAFIKSAKPYPVGTRLEMEIFLLSVSGENDDIIRTQGEVIRTEPKGMAVLFDDNYQILPIKYASEQ